MSPTLSSLLVRSCLENNLRKSSVLLPLALYIKYTNGRVLWGVDALAEESARRYDMSVCIIILPTHSCTVCITPLTESMLHEGLQHVLRANETLQCPLPNNVLKTGLLQRNTTKPHTLLGGTGWSVQMTLEQQKPVCVYTDQWYQFDYPQQRFVPCHPPYLHPQNTTIVGSRRIILQMAQELHNLFQRTIQLETRPLLNFWFH